MVLSVLVEAFGVKQPQHHVDNVMLPYFALLGVRLGNAVGAGSSSDRTQVQSLDDPRQSLDNPRRDESLGPLEALRETRGGRIFGRIVCSIKTMVLRNLHFIRGMTSHPLRST